MTFVKKIYNLMKNTSTTNDKKQSDDLNKTIENMRKLPHNKQCFDCGEKVH